MARFVKIIEKDDVEVILNIDEIQAIVKRATYYSIYVGGSDFTLSQEDYEKIKKLLIPDYPHY